MKITYKLEIKLPCEVSEIRSYLNVSKEKIKRKTEEHLFDFQNGILIFLISDRNLMKWSEKVNGKDIFTFEESNVIFEGDILVSFKNSVLSNMRWSDKSFMTTFTIIKENEFTVVDKEQYFPTWDFMIPYKSYSKEEYGYVL